MSKHNYSQYSKKKDNRKVELDANASNRKAESIPTETLDNVYVVAESTFKAESAEPTVTTTPTPVETVAMPELVQETVSTVTLPETVNGIVVNCTKLNVRENTTTTSSVVCVLDVMSEIQVDVNRSSDKWVYVRTATGVEGYCMRQYIDIRL